VPAVAGYPYGIEVLASTVPTTDQVLTLEVLDLSGGDYASAPVIGVASVTEAELGGFPAALDPSSVTATYFDLSERAIWLAAGSAAGFRLTSGTDVAENYGTSFSATDLYPSGSAFIGTVATGSDIAFKTFVGQEFLLDDEVERLDQYMLERDGASALHSARSIGQSFTAGQAGTLTAMEFEIFPGGSTFPDIVVDILDMTGGDYTTAPSLGSVNVAHADVGPFPVGLNASALTGTVVDLSSLAIDIEPGDALAVSLSTASITPELYAFGFRNVDRYPGGTAFVGPNALPTTDLVFKTFFVPEPSGCLGLGAGLLALAGLNARAKRRSSAAVSGGRAGPRA